MKLLLVSAMVGLLAATGSGVKAPLSTPVQEVTVQANARIGSLELPYAGQGSLYYDADVNEWAIGVPAPANFDCSEIGWSFEPPGVPNPTVSFSYTGLLDISEDCGIVSIFVIDTNGTTYFLDFPYDPDEMAYGNFTFTADGIGGVVEGTPPTPGSVHSGSTGSSYGSIETCPGVDKCPGGYCDCGPSGCKACCPAGFKAGCYCTTLPGNCRCDEVKPKKHGTREES